MHAGPRTIAGATSSVKGEEARVIRETRRRTPTPQRPGERASVLWSLTGPDFYRDLVRQRGWTHRQCEEWPGDLIVATLLEAQ